MNKYFFNKHFIFVLISAFCFFVLIPRSVSAQSPRLLGTGIVDGTPNSKLPDIEAFCSEVHLAATVGDNYGNLNNAMYWTKQDVSGNFGSPTIIGQTEGQADFSTANLAVAPNGTIHYAWIRGNDSPDKQIFYRSKPAGGTWGPPELAAATPGLMHYVNITVVGNQPIIVWRNVTINVTTRTGPNNWTSPVAVSGDDPFRALPGIASSSNGTVVITYPSEGEIKVAVKQGASPFAIQQISQGGGFSSDPAVAVGPNGAFYVVWRVVGSPAVPISVRNTNGTWSPPAGGLIGQAEVSSAPGISVDIQNGIHVAWSDTSGNGYYAYRAANSTSWQTAAPAPIGGPGGMKLATSFSVQRGIFAHGVTEEFDGPTLMARYFIYSPR